MAMYHRFSKVFMILLIATVLTGCLNAESIEQSIRAMFGNDSADKTCSDIELSNAKGKPLGTISLSVIPDEFTDMLAIHVESASNDNHMHIPAMTNGVESGADFIVPIHPDGSIQGGEVSLTVMDDTGEECELPDFTILPLKKAEGAFEELVELIEEANEAQGGMLGTRQQAAPGTPADTGVAIDFPGRIVEGILSDPANPNSLDNVVSGDAPATAEITEAGWEVIDSLIEESGVLEEMSNVNEGLEKIGDINSDGMAQAIESQNSESKHLACMGPIYTPTAEALSVMMSMQDVGEEAASIDAALDRLSTALGVGAAFSAGTGLIPAAGYLSAMGVAVYAIQTLSGALDGLFPEEMISLEIDYGENVFLEDDEILTGAWENAQLMTRSKGFNAGKAILNGVLEVSGSKALGGLNGSWMNKFSNTNVGSKMSALHDYSVSQFTDHMIEESTDGSDVAEIPPCDFGPTDITNEMWSKAQFIDADNANVIMTEHGHYEVIDAGRALFEVEPIKEKFGGQTIIEQNGILVNPIEVTINPTSYRGEPGDVVEFTATIENANNKDVTWSISPQGNHQYTISDNGDGTSVITIQTSENPEDYPATVRVESTSTTGLRGYSGAPPRFAEALLGGEHAHVEIDPDFACVKMDKKHTFTATVDGSNNEEVVWTATGGTISSQGVFTAGDEPGNYEVKATSVADPKAYTTTVVTVGSCLCSASIDLTDVGGNKALSVPWQTDDSSTTITLSGMDLKREDMKVNIVREGDLLDGSLAEIRVSTPGDMSDGTVDPTQIIILFPKDAGPMPGDTGEIEAEMQIRINREEGSIADYFVAESVPIILQLDEFTQGSRPEEAIVKGSFETPVQGDFHRTIYDGPVSVYKDPLIRQTGLEYGETKMHVAIEFQGEFSTENSVDFLDEETKDMLRSSDDDPDKWAYRLSRTILCKEVY